MDVVPYTESQSAVHRNDFESIPTLKMESGHPIEGPLDRDFSSIYIVMELQRPEVASRWKFWPKICVFLK